MSDVAQGPGWWQASDGKWYPPQAPSPPPGPGWFPPTKKKRRKWPWVLGALVVLVVIAGVAGGGDTKDTADTPSSVGASGADDAAAGIGVAVPAKDLIFTVVTVTDPYTPSNQFIEAKPGNRYVRVELQVQNTTKDSKLFSTLAQLKIRDAASRVFDVAIVGDTGASIDGQIPANSSNRGFVSFQVPLDSTGLQLQVQGDAFSGAKLISLA